MRRVIAMLSVWASLCLLALGVSGNGGTAAGDAEARAQVAVITINGPISPATADYLESAHEEALADGATAVVIALDTPGGLVTAMRDMIQLVLQSRVPVITWVSPEGARAASAGTYLLYASHVAAMAPATNVGAATPVRIGGAPSEPGPPSPGGADEAPEGEAGDGDSDAGDGDAQPTGDGDDDMSAGEKKAINDAVAYIRSLAERRGRNADWAEEAVREGVSISADEALERNVIDLVVPSLAGLLEAIDGREVALAGGATQTLALDDAEIRRYDPGWRYEFLAIITNPTIAYVLMMIGIYGLLLEGYSPGAILPGTVGAISLLLALYAFQLMPVSYAGLGLLVLGIVLMIAEALAPSFGILGFGGLAAFVLGSVFLMDTDVPGYDIHLGVIVGLSLASALLLGLTLYLLYRSRRARVTTGDEGTVDGQVGSVLSFSEGSGWMLLNGERWQIRSGDALQAGQTVRAVRHDGFTIEVEAADHPLDAPPASVDTR